MSRWSHVSEIDVRRALIVDRYTATSWQEYLAAVKQNRR